MQRIDFIGASGVGKTSLFNELISRRSETEKWMTIDEAKLIITLHLVINNFNDVKHKFFAPLLKFKYLNFIFAYVYKNTVHSYLMELLRKNKEQYSEFLEILLKNAVIKEEEPLYKLLNVVWFYNIFENVILIEQSPIEGVVIFDESLSHKLCSLSNSFTGIDDIAIMEFSTIPPPLAIIHCHLDPIETLQRLKQRQRENNKLILKHYNLNDDQLLESIKARKHYAQIGAQVMKDRGVKVIDIDMNDDTQQNLKKVINFLKYIVID